MVADDRVTFELDGQGASRVMYLDVQTPPAGVQPTTQGYSIGQWQGEMLVVDTTAFAADPEGLGYALPSSTAKHVSERFTLSEDRRTWNYEATLEDPQYLTEPVRVSTIWTYRPNLRHRARAATWSRRSDSRRHHDTVMGKTSADCFPACPIQKSVPEMIS